jgi:hemolysin III
VSRFKEPFNGLSHLVGAYLALIGTVVLVAASWGDAPKRLSLAVYGASLTVMLASSAAYHSIRCSPARVRRFRKIDHASIYLLIAGTNTPLCFNLFSGFWQWGLLAIVWGIAILGMVSKAFYISQSDWFFVSIYLGAGWISVLAIGEILRVLPAGAIMWLFAGGLLYSVGAILLVGKRLDFKPGVFGHHEVWHLFVVGAAFCHFMLMLKYVVPVT